MEPDVQQQQQFAGEFVGPSDYSMMQERIMGDQQAIKRKLIEYERAYLEGRLNVSAPMLGRIAASYEANIGRPFGGVTQPRGYGPPAIGSADEGDRRRAKIAGFSNEFLWGAPEFLLGAVPKWFGGEDFWRNEVANLDEHPELTGTYDEAGLWGLGTSVGISLLAGAGGLRAAAAGPGMMSRLTRGLAKGVGLAGETKLESGLLKAVTGDVGKSVLSGAAIGGMSSAVDYAARPEDVYDPMNVLKGAAMGGALGYGVGKIFNRVEGRGSSIGRKAMERRQKALDSIAEKQGIRAPVQRGAMDKTTFDEVRIPHKQDGSEFKAGDLYLSSGGRKAEDIPLGGAKSGRITDAERSHGGQAVRDVFGEDVAADYYEATNRFNPLGRQAEGPVNAAVHKVHNTTAQITQLDRRISDLEDIPVKFRSADENALLERLKGSREELFNSIENEKKVIRKAVNEQMEARVKEVTPDLRQKVIDKLFGRMGLSQAELKGQRFFKAGESAFGGRMGVAETRTKMYGDQVDRLIATIGGDETYILNAIEELSAEQASSILGGLRKMQGKGWREFRKGIPELFEAVGDQRAFAGAVKITRQAQALGLSSDVASNSIKNVEDAIRIGKISRQQGNVLLDEMANKTDPDAMRRFINIVEEELGQVTDKRALRGSTDFQKNKKWKEWIENIRKRFKEGAGKVEAEAAEEATEGAAKGGPKTKRHSKADREKYQDEAKARQAEDGEAVPDDEL